MSPLLSGSLKSPQAGFRRRWLHQTLARNAILMPAMSPFMTSGTIARWRKKEGEAFAAGEVLLQIKHDHGAKLFQESDIAMIDVEAETAGILGKILANLLAHFEPAEGHSHQLPDGSQDVPVEQVIALVINEREFSESSHVLGPTSPATYTFLKSPRGRVETMEFNQPFMSPTLRSPTIEIHHAHHRGMATQHAKRQNLKLTIDPPSPRMTVSLPIIDRSTSSQKVEIAPVAGESQPAQAGIDERQVTGDSTLDDGVSIRQMIRSSLARTPLSGRSQNIFTASCGSLIVPSIAVPYSSSIGSAKCDYFNGIL
ncbi:hypothetical protein H0H93_013638 [Arthromyces matolae]|nr:hypothetical protein H0H93_013638 [Arthromyces matolae]